jgi:16S rRNA (guanine966-N2)-methyltransferase
MRVVAGESKGQRIGSLKRLGARPTTQRVRASLFAILEADGLEGKRIVDLYAGTGTLGIEALSRGAIWADFVEASPKRCALLRKNLTALGYSARSKVHCMKVERALKSLGNSYDLVLMDPPYTLGPVHHIMDKVGALAKEGALIAAGHSKHHPLQPRYDGLELVRERQYGDTVCSIYREGGEPW